MDSIPQSDVTTATEQNENNYNSMTGNTQSDAVIVVPNENGGERLFRIMDGFSILRYSP